MADEFCLKMPDFHVTFRDLLHAINLRHGTNGFTSFPKEGVLRIFSPWKIRLLKPGLNSRTWVPNASSLPRDHRSRLLKGLIHVLCVLYYFYYNHQVVRLLVTTKNERKFISLFTNTYPTQTAVKCILKGSILGFKVAKIWSWPFALRLVQAL